MAQEEIIFKVGVDTGDSANKVATVEEQFDILKKTISDTEQEVEDLTKQFGKNSQEVENARKKLGNLNASFKELKQASINVNSTFAQVYDDLQPLTTRLGEAEDRLYELSLAGKQNTKEYKDLLETVARYKQTQIETDRIVDQAALTMTQKLGAAIQGAANGFMVVQGASALFGSESKELEKALLKVQAAMALAQGIEGVRQAIPLFSNFANTIKTKVIASFTSLRGAIMSTGIGALVVAIGYLISNFDKLKGAMSSGLTAAKNFETSTSNQAEEARKASDNFAEYERTLRRLGYTEDEINNKRKARYKDAIEKTQKEIAASKDVYKEQLKNLKIVEGFDKWGFNATGRLLFGDEEDAKAQQQKIKDLNASLIKLRNDQFDYNQKIKEDRKKDNEDAKNKLKEANDEAARKAKERKDRLKQLKAEEDAERITLQRKFEDLTVANIDDANARDIMAMKLKHDREKEDLKKQYADKKGLKQEFDKVMLELDANQIIETEKLKEEQKKAQEAKDLEDKNKKFEDQKTSLEAEIITNAENFALKQEKQLELENADYEQKKLNAQGNKAQLELIEAQHASNVKAINKEATDYQKMLDEELKNAKMSLVEQTSAMFGELANVAEQGSAIQKAFAITQLTIDTAKSISSVIAGATAAAAAGGPAAPFLIGGYIASGIATVTKSMSTAKKLLNAPLPSVQPPSANRPTDNAQGTTQQGTQQTVQAQSTYKVVVVDSDITKMQDKTKKVNAISTI